MYSNRRIVLDVTRCLSAECMRTQAAQSWRLFRLVRNTRAFGTGDRACGLRGVMLERVCALSEVGAASVCSGR